MEVLRTIPLIGLLVQKFITIIHSIQLRSIYIPPTAPLPTTTIEDITFAEDPQKESIPSFLGLPRELRNLIYEYALTYPKTSWDARHKALCPHRSRHGMRRNSLTPSTETPPFVNRPSHILLMKNRALADDQTKPDYLPCTCHRYYTGASLLRTNHQINAEASLVFYSSNTVTFEDDRVLRRFLSTAREHIRDHIRHISLLSLDPTYYERPLSLLGLESSPLLSSNASNDSLYSFTNLQTLELRPQDLIQSGSPFNMAACFAMRNLKITMAICRPLLEIHEDHKELNALWIKISQPLVISGKGRRFKDSDVVEFASFVVSHCTFEAKQRLNIALEQRPRATSFTTKMSHMESSWIYGVDWEDNVPSSDWVDPVPVFMDIWGLPSTNNVRTKLSREEVRHERELKSKGLPTTAEIKAEDERKTKMREARLSKHQKRVHREEEKDAKMAMLRERELQQREENRLQRLREAKLAEKEAARNNRVTMIREANLAGHSRHIERKRTSRNATRREGNPTW